MAGTRGELVPLYSYPAPFELASSLEGLSDSALEPVTPVTPGCVLGGLPSSTHTPACALFLSFTLRAHAILLDTLSVVLDYLVTFAAETTIGSFYVSNKHK